MHVVTMKYCIIVIYGKWDSSRQQFALNEPRQPGKCFFFNPKQIRLISAAQLLKTPSIGEDY